MKRIFKSLEKDGLVISGTYNKAAFDKTKWYTIDYDKVSNMVMLGAIVRETGVVKIESFEAVMKKNFKGKKADLIPLNMEALRAWK